MDELNNMEAVIDAARKSVEADILFQDARHASVFLPMGNDGNGQVVEVELEKWLAQPARKRGHVVVFDPLSFNQIITDNSDAGNITIYIDRDPERPAVVGVLNGNGKSGAGWGDFRVEIGFRYTPQWLKWKKIDGQLLPQAAFAEFIEDNLADIADPPGATMLEIASYLQATRSVSFKSALRLGSGAIQFQNIEDIDAKVGSGLVAVPETFTLGIAPMFGSPAYSVPVRFRYRITDGKMTLGIKLQRVEDLMGKLIEDVLVKIERGTTFAVSVVDGKAPEPTR